jgi:hypothetical protein
LLCLQAMSVVHDIADSPHDAGTQCEFCLKFSRTGFALVSSIGQVVAFWRIQCISEPEPESLPPSGRLLAPESRGPPA